MYRAPEMIKCPSCGRSTGLPKDGFHMVIPPGGLKCGCGATVLRETLVELNKLFEQRYSRSKLLEINWEFVK